MALDTSKMTVEEAKALLTRDQLNRVKRVSTKGGTLAIADERRLRTFIKKHEAQKPLPKDKISQTLTVKEPKFDGTFEKRRRRKRVYMLRLQNYSIREMCRELDISHPTIVSDLRYIEEALQKDFDPTIANEIVNEAILDLEAVRMMAIEALKHIDDDNNNGKNGYLNTIASVTELKIKILQDAGVVPRTPKRTELTGPDGGAIPIGATEPVINVTFEESAETRRIEEKYNVLPN